MRVLRLTAEEVGAIHEAWMSGVSINTICSKFNHGTEQIRALARDNGWPDRGIREPLPAGHPSTWGALVRGTLCELIPFSQAGMA